MASGALFSRADHVCAGDLHCNMRAGHLLARLLAGTLPEQGGVFLMAPPKRVWSFSGHCLLATPQDCLSNQAVQRPLIARQPARPTGEA